MLQPVDEIPFSVSPVQAAQSILATAKMWYRPDRTFALLSGGHDSLATTHVAMNGGFAECAFHIDTGTGIRETRRFVERTCKERGWPLLVLETPRDIYRQLVLRNGFPGPSYHRFCYAKLKERRLRDLKRLHKGERLLLITGVRAQESVRRMGHVEVMHESNGFGWAAPLIDWSGMDVRDHIADAGLQTNPVVDLLHMSGECRCGAFAKSGELDEQEAWFPGSTQWIRDLEAEAAALDLPARWGARPSRYHTERKRGQLTLPLCSSCEYRVTERLEPAEREEGGR